MNRIQILGPCGSGKSTFARKLGDILKIPVYHMDQLYWQPGWTPSTDEEITKKVKVLTQEQQWIFDGNYTQTLNIRINQCDTIIYLDVATWRYMYRIAKRLIQFNGRTRPDMTPGCPERLDFSFLHFALTWNIRKRKKTLQMLEAHKKSHSIFHLKNAKEVTSFLENTAHQKVT